VDNKQEKSASHFKMYADHFPKIRGDNVKRLLLYVYSTVSIVTG